MPERLKPYSENATTEEAAYHGQGDPCEVTLHA
jgi:hypothetical protein